MRTHAQNLLIGVLCCVLLGFLTFSFTRNRLEAPPRTQLSSMPSNPPASSNPSNPSSSNTSTSKAEVNLTAPSPTSRPTPAPTFKPFDYSEIEFQFSAGQDRAAFFNELSLQVMHRAWVWNSSSCDTGLAAPFCRFLQRLGNRQCVSIFVIGGSNTMGLVVTTPNMRWFELLEKWMNTRLPCDGGTHKVHAHWVSGAGSSQHLGNVASFKDRKGNFDLFLLELGANDLKGVEDAPYTEALVYSIATRQHQPAVGIVTTVSPGKFYGGPQLDKYEDLHEANNHLPISRHLNLPFVSFPYAFFQSPGKTSNLYVEGTNNRASALYLGVSSGAMLWYDGLHLSPAGHALLASTMAMFFLAAIPNVRGVNVPSTPVDVVNLSQHALFPASKDLLETRPPLLSRSFIESSLPAGFVPPAGWKLVNERSRFGLAAFGGCDKPRGTEMDPCSDPLTAEIAGDSFTLSHLRSYVDMGILLVQTPPDALFDFCQSPLQVPNATCVVDGIFLQEEMNWRVSLPTYAKMHLIPKDKGGKLSFPMNLTVHVASPALATTLTRRNTVYWHGAYQTPEPPLRGLHKCKILGWQSFSGTKK